MIRQLTAQRRQYILVDINTQENLLLARSDCLRHIHRIMAWARLKRITVISTCNACSKIRYTLLKNRFSFPVSDSTDIPINLLYQYQQVILQKRCIDPFEEPRIDRLLSIVQAKEFILIGAIAEEDVLITALGLLQRGRNVVIVTDALGMHNKKKANLALRKMDTKGAKLIKTQELVGVSQLQQASIL